MLTNEELEKPFVTEDPSEEVQGEQGEAGAAEPSAEENKVPYSRFKKFHERAITAEQEKQLWKDRYEALEREGKEFYPKHEVPGAVPEWWLKLYGDTTQTREGWDVYQKARESEMSSLKKQLRSEAIEELRDEQRGEQQRITKNLETIDDNLDNLSAFVGRDLTDSEQSKVLDIVDEFTPKDDDGNYLGNILSFEKAWEVYEMRSKVGNAGRRESRDRIAGLSGAQSRGEPTTQAEEDKNFKPGAWGAWRKRLNL